MAYALRHIYAFHAVLRILTIRPQAIRMTMHTVQSNVYRANVMPVPYGPKGLVLT